MTTYQTNNPLGSSDPRDLYDNSENMDVALNGTTSDTWVDRRGVTRKSWAGIEQQAIAGALVVDTAEDLQQIVPETDTAAADVTKDPNPENNGRWAWDKTAAEWYKVPNNTDEKIEAVNQAVIDNTDPVGFDEYEDVVINEAGWVQSGVNSETGLMSGNWDQADRTIGVPFLDVEYVDVYLNEDGYIVRGTTYDSRTVSDSQTELPNVYVSIINGYQHVMMFDQGREIPIGVAGQNSGIQQTSNQIKWIERGYLKAYQRWRDMPFSDQPFAITKLIHYVGYGQSLGVGLMGSPAILQTPPMPDRVIMFNGGVLPAGGAAEEWQDTETQGFEAAKNVWINECPILSGGCQIAKSRSETILVSSFARNGTKIEDLSRGSQPYDNMIHGIAMAYSWCMYHGIEYELAPISFVHGSANAGDSPAVYTAKVETWYAQLNEDVKAITGWTSDIKIILDQARNGVMGITQFQLALDFPDRYRCVGPQSYGHQLADNVHMLAPGYVNEGAKAGRALLDWENWWPLYPTSAIRTGTSVVLTFHNPSNTPLVLDTTTVTNMTDGMFGFRWIDSTSSATVTAVAVSGNNTVTLTLSNVPTGSSPQVGIADLNDGTVIAEDGTVVPQDKRSNLRDSNTDLDLNNGPMWNWAAHYRVDVQ